MRKSIQLGVVFLILLSLLPSASAQQSKSTASKDEVSSGTERLVLTKEQVKGLREGKLVPLTQEQKTSAKGEGFVAVAGAGFAVLGAALNIAQLWQWHHAGHGHQTQIHIHYWRRVPYVHFHHP